MQRLTILLLLLMFSFVASAQVYKWVDADGKTQYTDQPPPSGAAQDEKKLDIKPAPPSSSNGHQSDSANVVDDDKPQNFSERRSARKEAKAEKERAAEELNQKCIHAQGQLKMYRDTPRLRVPDGNGGVVYVDDNVREKHIQEAQKNIAAFCK